MPANLKDPFSPSCCDGGACSTENSAQSCGCDPGIGYVVPGCWKHQPLELEKEKEMVSNDWVPKVLGTLNVAQMKSTTMGGGPLPFIGKILPAGSPKDEIKEFLVKDSGKRQSFDSGMVRDVTEDKVDYSLALDGPMFKRLAIHLTKGAKKYDKRNWLKASGQAEYDRFRESALRHFLQWFNGEIDEDHASAVFFNVNGAEYVRGKLEENR